MLRIILDGLDMSPDCDYRSPLCECRVLLPALYWIGNTKLERSTRRGCMLCRVVRVFDPSGWSVWCGFRADHSVGSYG